MWRMRARPPPCAAPPRRPAHAAPPRGCAPPRPPPRARGPLRPPLRRRVAVPRAAAVRTASQHGHPCLQTRPPYAPCDAGWLWVAVGSCKQCGGRAGAWNRASRLALRTPRTCGPPSCQAGCQARGALQRLPCRREAGRTPAMWSLRAAARSLSAPACAPPSGRCSAAGAVRIRSRSLLGTAGEHLIRSLTSISRHVGHGFCAYASEACGAAAAMHEPACASLCGEAWVEVDPARALQHPPIACDELRLQCCFLRTSVQAGTAAVPRAAPLPASPRCSAHRVTVLTSADTARSARACAPRSIGPRCSRSQAAPVPPGAGAVAAQPPARSRPSSTALTLLTHRYLYQPATDEEPSLSCVCLYEVRRARPAHQLLAALANIRSRNRRPQCLRPLCWRPAMPPR